MRSVFFNVFQSLIVLLYVLDNDTNTLIRISVGIGLLIELWKIQKVTDVTLDRERKIFGLIPRISIEDKGSYAQSSTKEYDRVSHSYLSKSKEQLLIFFYCRWHLNICRGGYSHFFLDMQYTHLFTWNTRVIIHGFLVCFTVSS